jgi:hypothetical protein
VYVDTTGVYAPELEYIESQDGHEAGPWRVYRVVLERPRFKTLTDKGRQQPFNMRPLPASARNDTWVWYNEWFVKYLPSVASSCGTTPLRLLRLLFSKDPTQRASAYLDIAMYHGWGNFDSYPLTYTREQRDELEARCASKPLEVL